MRKWYQLAGKENDIAIQTKVALARNITGHPFTIRLDSAEKDQIGNDVMNVLNRALPGKFLRIPMKDLNRNNAISLAERGLVSPEFVSFVEGRTFITTPDESLSMMICEEDHVKLQALLPGLELDKAYELVDQMDSILDQELAFAFDKKLGYLTQCPTNIGTAMRATVMLQLPALHIRARINHLANTVSKLGLTLSGAFGEGNQSVGSLYVLSNQMTLGISEKDALANLNALALSIIEQERQARKELMNNLKFQDMLYRSLGTLQSARVMTFNEFMENASIVKVGMSAGEIAVPQETVNALYFTLQPATMNASAETMMDRQTRDAKRADEVRLLFETKTT